MVASWAVVPWFIVSAVAQLPPVPDVSGSSKQPQPKLFVAQRMKDLGSLVEGAKPTVHWQLENHGDAPLVIDRARAGCGCTVVQLTEQEKVLPPGGVLDFRAVFDTTGRHGAQDKKVNVYSNDPAESTLKLEFTATVEFLFEIRPAGLVNLRALRRGEPADRTIEVIPGPGHENVEALTIDVPKGSPLHFSEEPFDSFGRTGRRIHVTADPEAALGTASAKATLKLRVDGIERDRVLSVRGEVVGDLTWHPKVLDRTRQPSPPGQRFAPLTIRSTDKAPFTITRAQAGSRFDVAVEPFKRGRRGTEYRVLLTVRKDAPPGPFGTTLSVETSSLDEPLIRVPVFGVVAAKLEVEPPVIALRQDGTPMGTRRRVKLQAWPQVRLTVEDIACGNGAVSAVVNREASARYQHIRFVDVTLSGKLPPGKHETSLTLTTNVPGVTHLTIPVVIDVPVSGG